MVPRTGRYQCGQCRLTFSVTATGSVVDAGCPGCGKFRPVDRLGRYACSSCGLEFEVTREGVWVDATCPVCRRSRQVSRMGRFECSRCQSVFRAEPGRTVVEATCPACAEVQDVEGPGIFRCNGCDTVFTVAGPEAENSPRPQVAADRSDARQEQQRILRRFMATETKRRIRSEPSKPADATA
jgi:rubredoxin